MTTKNLVFVQGDDWEGLYACGKLIAQGHSLSATQILKALEFDYEYSFVDEDWLGNLTTLPANLEDVVLDE